MTPILLIVLLLLSAISPAPAPAAAPDLEALLGEPEYVVTHWTSADGLPVETLGRIVRSADGYLWIASWDGLLRFDGARFRVFDTSSVPELGSQRIVRLVQAADGALWIRTEPGRILRYAEGRFERVSPPELEAEAGRGLDLVPLGDDFFVLTDLGLFVYRGSGLEPVLEGRLRDPRIHSLHRDARGRLWIGTATSIARFDGRELLEWSSGLPEGPVFDIASNDEGLFFALQGGLVRFADGAFERLIGGEIARLEQREPGRSPVRPVVCRHAQHCRFELEGRDYVQATASAHGGAANSSVRLGPDGATWVMAMGELFRNGRRVLETPSFISSFTFDHEGTVWVATVADGLYSLRPPRVRMLGEAEGLLAENVHSVHQDRQGRLWVATAGLGNPTVFDGARVSHADCGVYFLATIYDDPASDLAAGPLLGTTPGLYRASISGVGAGECRQLTDEPESFTSAMLRTRDGRLVRGVSQGFSISRPGDPDAEGEWRFRRFHELEGQPLASVRTIHERSEGSLWLGTVGSGLLRLDTSGELTRIDTDDGLPSNIVRHIHEDEHGDLWIATEDRGLARLRLSGSAVEPVMDIVGIDERDGLFDNSLHQILDDGLGHYWFSSNRGLFRIAKEELEAFADGERARVETVAYTEADGMADREANGGRQGAGIRATDGKLYFATQEGVAVIDPEPLIRDLPPPPIHVEGLVTGRTEHLVLRGPITLEADERSFRIEYTAISHTPERMRFLYRLEGYDEAWQDAGTARSAAYTKVPPGSYTFHLRARSAEGVWAEAGTPLELVVRPFTHETWWFRLLCVAGLVMALRLALLLRDRRRLEQQTRRRQELETEVEARTEDLKRERDRVSSQAALLAEQAERLSALDRAKSELFANISHEFRTPLTLTLGPLGDLVDGAFGELGAEAVREVEKVRGQSARLLELVNQLLDVASLDAGGLRLEPERADLVAFVRRLGERFVGLAERRGVVLELAVPEQPVWLDFDPEQLDKVMSNLLSNALKFTPADGRVMLDVRAPETGRARVLVRDTGPGIEAAEQEKIFDRFYRSESAAKRCVPGTGLGLALARDLVVLHGGTLRVESESGRGSTFVVELPARRVGEGGAPDRRESKLARRAEAPLPTRDPSGRVAALEASLAAGETQSAPVQPAPMTPMGNGEEDRTTILVVDDHPELRAYIRRHLEPDFRVLEAADGAAGLALARERMPDLVVSDVMMPEMDGFELTHALRADPGLDWLPVVLLTARAEAEDKIAGLGRGADDYLAKPFDMRELLARIRNLIAQRQRLRERLREEARRIAERRTVREAAARPAVGHRNEGRREGRQGGWPSSALAQAARRKSQSGAWPSLGRAGSSVSDKAPGRRRRALPVEEKPLLERVMETIAEHLSDESFNADGLASHLAMSRTRLYRCLREVTDVSPARLILEQRIAKSRQLLRQRQINISETAYAVGFKSVAHFSRQFRAVEGRSPSAFRSAQDDDVEMAG